MQMQLRRIGHAMTRRSFLGSALLLAAPVVVGGHATAAILNRDRRDLAFENLHTGEQLNIVYFSYRQYVPEALRQINWVLRDVRTGESAPIDPRLLDLLFRLRLAVAASSNFQVISGYRSPKTNALLASRSEGVALKSLHTQGKAIDIRVPGISLRQLRDAAKSLKAGGVGYYSQSNFVHVDIGRVRFW